jgi:undecaprenyl-diphosphatase
MVTTNPTTFPNLRALLCWGALLLLLGAAFVTDNWVMSWLEPVHDSAAADLIKHTIRWLGTGYVQIAMCLTLILIGWRRNRHMLRAGGYIALAFLASGVAVNVLKVIFHRARPYVTDPPPLQWTGYLRDSHFQSFPSAETTTTFAVAVMLGLWYPHLRLPLLIIAAMVGFARVFVGGHHPSDVVAGAMLGIGITTLLWRRIQAQEGIDAA